MATTETTEHTYDNQGRVVRTVTTKGIVAVTPKPVFVVNVRIADSPEWVAAQVERVLRDKLRGSMFRGAEIKITRDQDDEEF